MEKNRLLGVIFGLLCGPTRRCDASHQSQLSQFVSHVSSDPPTSPLPLESLEIRNRNITIRKITESLRQKKRRFIRALTIELFCCVTRQGFADFLFKIIFIALSLHSHERRAAAFAAAAAAAAARKLSRAVSESTINFSSRTTLNRLLLASPTAPFPLFNHGCFVSRSVLQVWQVPPCAPIH